ncbi:hypothetical protein F5888DRAFT_1710504 [Russula emetica]|nr:hypothetical protein F5888DRAFT_1758971 [Russula emetica]KAF8495808.1 hypothetical protein F5888DRAFT_1710504 [Russula emetica]
MSSCAVLPETYAAWSYLETDDDELHEREEAEMVRGEEELGLLLKDLEASPTVAKLEQYLKRLFELQCFTQRSIARKLERYQHEDVYLADLEERPGAYLCFGTEEEIQRHMEGLATQREEKDRELARLAAQVEEGQRSYAENVHRLYVVNGLIAKRRAREQELEFEGEEEGAHGANKVLGRDLAI